MLLLLFMLLLLLFPLFSVRKKNTTEAEDQRTGHEGTDVITTPNPITFIQFNWSGFLFLFFFWHAVIWLAGFSRQSEARTYTLW